MAFLHFILANHNLELFMIKAKALIYQLISMITTKTREEIKQCVSRECGALLISHPEVSFLNWTVPELNITVVSHGNPASFSKECFHWSSI